MNRCSYHNLICLLCGLLVSTAALPAEAPANAVDNQEHHFRLTYPAELKPMDLATPRMFVKLGSQADGPNDIFRESLSVNIEAKGLANVSLEQAFKGMSGSMTKHGIKILESTDAKLGGLEAKRIVYTHSLKLPGGQVQVKAVMYMLLKNGVSYSVDIRATDQTFETFLPIGQKVVDSFRWTDK